MWRIRKTYVLIATLIAVPAGAAWAEGFTDLLAQYDRNGNGLLEAHERAMLAAAKTAEHPVLSAFPVVCEGEPASGGESASAGGSATENEQPPQRGVAHQAQLRWEQIAMQMPPAGDQAEQDAEAEAQAAAEGYPTEAPAPPEPPRQVVQIRNAVHYRMMLNQQHAQARPRPFAQAATFGPVVGRNKRVHFASAVHDHCGCSRASLYLAGY